MTRTVVGVLRGGTSSEYNLSLKTGAAMHAALPEDRYDVRDILIDRRGNWNLRGLPVQPARALSQIDVVLNALHGGIGEDGTVQRILDRSGVAYAGPRPQAAHAALNKIRARGLLRAAGVRMPHGVSFNMTPDLTTADMARAVFASFGPPYVVKPPSEGAGSGIRIAQSIVDLPDAIGDTLDAYGAVLVEEFIMGDEVSVGIIDGFRGEERYVLPPAHTVHGARFLHPQLHEDASVRYIVPSRFTHAQKLSIADVARMAHRALGMRHVSRSDMIVTPRGVYMLEVNANPGLYPGSSFPLMLESVGSSVGEYLDHLIGIARVRD